jgi:copper chaperone CopZ
MYTFKGIIIIVALNEYILKMKNVSKIVLCFLCLFIITTISCKNSGTQTQKTVDPNAFTKIEVSIGGMFCTECENTIQTRVAQVDGIDSVKADYTTGIAVIGYNPTIADTTSIKEAINNTGYTFNKFIFPAEPDSIK